MNIYRAKFSCLCAKNSDVIQYSLEIHSERMIFIEDIEAAISEYKNQTAYHEPMADKLYRKLGGKQIMTANHGGIEIETRRG